MKHYTSPFSRREETYPEVTLPSPLKAGAMPYSEYQEAKNAVELRQAELRAALASPFGTNTSNR